MRNIYIFLLKRILCFILKYEIIHFRNNFLLNSIHHLNLCTKLVISINLSSFPKKEIFRINYHRMNNKIETIKRGISHFKNSQRISDSRYEINLTRNVITIEILQASSGFIVYHLAWQRHWEIQKRRSAVVGPPDRTTN